MAEKGHWEYRTVDPRSVKPHHQNVNQKAVDYYKKNPQGKFDSSSGEPEVDEKGNLVNGVHRRQAAIETGRSLRVKQWVPDSDNKSSNNKGREQRKPNEPRPRRTGDDRRKAREDREAQRKYNAELKRREKEDARKLRRQQRENPNTNTMRRFGEHEGDYRRRQEANERGEHVGTNRVRRSLLGGSGGGR